jgi:hypothetical protein
MVKVRVEKVARPGCAPCFVLDMICEGGVKHESHRSGGGTDGRNAGCRVESTAELQVAGRHQTAAMGGGEKGCPGSMVGVRRGCLIVWQGC